MALFAETVPKALYDQLWDKYSELLDKYHSLRATHQPTTPLKRIAPTGDSAQRAMQAGERAIRDPRLAEGVLKLVGEGMSEADALVEASRLLDVYKGKADPGGPPRAVKAAPSLMDNLGPALR
jgi:hypothetical protein